MATMNVSLPDALKKHVEERVASGEYASASDFVRDLVRKDIETKKKWDEYRRLIQEGIDSPVSDATFDEIVEAALTRASADGAPD
ncbi:MAG: type II toxin-antitoxin system ParD family antitoxin [Oceanicaulis sp.]